MKTLALAVGLAALPLAAFAQAPNVPTGYQVPGPTNYRLEVGTYRVIHVDCDKRKDFLEIKNMAVCQRTSTGDPSGHDPSPPSGPR